VKALLDNRKRYQERAERIGMDRLIEEEPKAKGYLRDPEGYRLFEKREDLCGRLVDGVRENREWLLETLRYPLAAS
jgi:deoxyhypusine synthase